MVQSLLLGVVGMLLAACGSGGGHASTTGPSSSTAPSTTLVQTSTSSTTTTTTSPMQAPMTQPTSAHPLTILEIGDSLGEDLGFGLGDDVFAEDPYVHIVQDAVGDTGLARPDYYNWPAHLAAELQADHPGAVIVFLGGNDAQSFDQNGQVVELGSSSWHRIYSGRVADVMHECVDAGARVLWVGMPIMQDPGFASEMEMLNSIYRAEAARTPGVTYVSSWLTLASPSGSFELSVVVDGETQYLRTPDGVHIANYGDYLLAKSLIAPMQAAWHIHLFPPGSAVPSTTAYG